MCTDFGGRRFPAALTLTGAEAVAIIPNGTALVSYATIIDWFPVVIVAGAANSGGAGFRTVNIPNRAAFSARDRQAGRRLGHQLRADLGRHLQHSPERWIDVAAERSVKTCAIYVRLFRNCPHSVRACEVADRSSGKSGIIGRERIIEVLRNPSRIPHRVRS
jgi:hypothetical protein